jgi:hypothetical protein
MMESPTRLSEKILTQIAARYAQQCQAQDKTPLALAWSEAKTATKGAFRAGVRELLAGYGHDRWPVGPFLRYRARRLRSKFRVMRGLAPLASKPRDLSASKAAHKS